VAAAPIIDMMALVDDLDTPLPILINQAGCRVVEALGAGDRAALSLAWRTALAWAKNRHEASVVRSERGTSSART